MKMLSVVVLFVLNLALITGVLAVSNPAFFATLSSRVAKPQVLGIQAGQATVRIVPSILAPAVNQPVTVQLMVSAPDSFRFRGAQFSILVPSSVNVSNNISGFSVFGNTDAFPRLSQHYLQTTGQTLNYNPLETVQYNTTTKEIRITIVTVHPSISGIDQMLPTAGGAVALATFTLTPTQTGNQAISFRAGFPHMIADEQINYLNTANLQTVTLNVGGTGCILKTQGDIDCSGEINVFDLGTLLSSFGTNNANADLDGSGQVTVVDLSILLSHFGQRG